MNSAALALRATKTGSQTKIKRFSEGVEWGGVTLPFILCHVAVLGAIWSGVTLASAICCISLYYIRLFAVTGGYHRYFSHRTFKTSRAFQLLLAFLAQTSTQKGVMWWVGHHRWHHRYSDTPMDVHSPTQDGFWYSHVGWLFDHTRATRHDLVRDWNRYPELVFLNRHYLFPPISLAIGTFLLFSWPGLFIGFFLSTVLLWHSTFAVNSLTHVVGSRRYKTPDTSGNSFWVAMLTMGEGWHNNHHYAPGSTRQGFFWWEIDPTFYILKVLSWFHIVWDLRSPPPRAYQIPEKDKA